jgi:hypothetical protein
MNCIGHGTSLKVSSALMNRRGIAARYTKLAASFIPAIHVRRVFLCL